MIFLAEFGDKTQLAVAAMSSTKNLYGVYIGSSLVLIVTSALGVFAGRRWLSKMNPRRLHQFSGFFFILLAGLLLLKLF